MVRPLSKRSALDLVFDPGLGWYHGGREYLRSMLGNVYFESAGSSNLFPIRIPLHSVVGG